jgi:hypothetical protein
LASLNSTNRTSLVPVENALSTAVIYDIGEGPHARRIAAAEFEYRQIETREEWLMCLVNALHPAFEEIGHPLPMQVRVTCGWPSKAALAPRHRRIGECWPSEASVDQTVEIFISPCLGTGLDAAETLVHELVHAAGAKGHRGLFPSIAKTIGLKRPWRATTATPALRQRLNDLISQIGPYPHATLDMSMRPSKKDSTRLRKVFCPACGYTVRTTTKWIEFGLPTCPCSMLMRVAG